MQIGAFLRQLFQGNWLFLSGLGALQVLSGLAPVLGMWFTAELIDQIVYQQGLPLPKALSGTVLLLLSCCVVLVLLEEIFSVFHGVFVDSLKDIIYRRMKYFLIQKISSTPHIGLFEDPALQDQIALAHETTRLISDYVSLLSYIFMGIFTLIPAFVLSASIEWWIPIVILGTMIPLLHIKSRIQRKSWDIHKSYGPIFKQLEIYEEILTSAPYAQEVRLYGMAHRILQRWEAAFHGFFQAVQHVRYQGGWCISAFALLSTLAMGACFWYIAQGAISGIFTVGQLSFIFGVVIQLRSGIAGLIYNMADILKAFLSLKPFVHLLALSESKPSPTQQVPAEHRGQALLTFEHVSFSYPGQSQRVLEDICLTITPGEKLAIVGENGSGKSTLLKLICRVYQPTSGTLLWKDTPVETLPFETYRAHLTALFQNFAHFPLSVRENVDVRQASLSDAACQDALAHVKLTDVLIANLDRVLCRRLEGGLEISGGQWQRLALARAYATYESAELLLLDEPTSALDPHAEHEMIELIRTMMNNKTSIVVSHRLALARFVDKIIVLAQGKIIEEGSHAALMKKQGAYFEMFQKQARYYQF